MSTLSLMNPEAPRVKLDWRLPVLLVVMNLVAIGIQWGVMGERIEAAMRKQEQQDKHMEAIDNELKIRATESGEDQEFRRNTSGRLERIERKIDSLDTKH